jgi:hypothetical protein
MDGSAPAPIHDGVLDVDAGPPVCMDAPVHPLSMGTPLLAAVSVKAANPPTVSEDAPAAQPLAITIDPPPLPPVPHPHSLPSLLPVTHPPAPINMPPSENVKKT